jgi:hypothetical protein
LIFLFLFASRQKEKSGKPKAVPGGGAAAFNFLACRNTGKS